MTVKIGDIVMLKSGGPAMTVLLREHENWVCQWFDPKKGEHMTDAFPETSLQPVPEENEEEPPTRQIGFSPI
jgi:uncharacterized protein YodC (DUF2158 family)